MRLYFDTCCYGRPEDDQKIINTRTETLAIYAAINICKVAGVSIYGSPALIDEIGDIEEDERGTRVKVRRFYDRTVTAFIDTSADIILRAREFMAAGMKEYDSYHLALSEAAEIDVLLSTDKKFVKRAARLCDTVRVINPKQFLREAEKWVR